MLIYILLVFLFTYLCIFLFIFFYYNIYFNCRFQLFSNIVLWFEADGFSGLFSKELWSHSSIAYSFWVVNCQSSSSLTVRVEDWFSVAFCWRSSFVCGGWVCCLLVEILGYHLPTQIIKLTLLSLSYMFLAPFIFSILEVLCLSLMLLINISSSFSLMYALVVYQYLSPDGVYHHACLWL